MATDPVCGMIVEEATARWKSIHLDKTYYFCNPVCKRTFEENAHLMIRVVKTKMSGISLDTGNLGSDSDAQ